MPSNLLDSRTEGVASCSHFCWCHQAFDWWWCCVAAVWLQGLRGSKRYAKSLLLVSTDVVNGRHIGLLCGCFVNFTPYNMNEQLLLFWPLFMSQSQKGGILSFWMALFFIGLDI